MSVSMVVVQGMMADMQKQNAENLATLARQQFDALQLLVSIFPTVRRVPLFSCVVLCFSFSFCFPLFFVLLCFPFVFICFG